MKMNRDVNKESKQWANDVELQLNDLPIEKRKKYFKWTFGALTAIIAVRLLLCFLPTKMDDALVGDNNVVHSDDLTTDVLKMETLPQKEMDIPDELRLKFDEMATEASVYDSIESHQ